MKFTLISFCFAVFLIGAQSAPQHFDFNGMKGIIDTTSVINGVEDKDGAITTHRFTQAEDVIKAMIEKHLAKKKQAKKAAKVQPAPAAPAPAISEPVVQEKSLIPDGLSNLAINWDEYPEARDILNQRVPGGTAAVDALITQNQIQ